MNGNPNEMADLTNDDFALIWPMVVARAMAIPTYRDALLAAFPGKTEADINIVHVAEAIGAFMTEAFTALDSPFDRYLAGNHEAMSDAQKRGAMLFYGRASCGSCHSGGLQTDFGFYNVAAPQVGTGKGDEAPLDHGRGRVTGKEEDRFKFRTPSLRNIELEGPWMHNGAFANLEDTVRHHLDPEASLKAYDDKQVEPELHGTYQSCRRDAEALARDAGSETRGERRAAHGRRGLGSDGLPVGADGSRDAEPVPPDPGQPAERATSRRLRP